jgi:hypothetical protein
LYRVSNPPEQYDTVEFHKINFQETRDLGICCYSPNSYFYAFGTFGRSLPVVAQISTRISNVDFTFGTFNGALAENEVASSFAGMVIVWGFVRL